MEIIENLFTHLRHIASHHSEIIQEDEKILYHHLLHLTDISIKYAKKTDEIKFFLNIPTIISSFDISNIIRLNIKKPNSLEKLLNEEIENMLYQPTNELRDKYKKMYSDAIIEISDFIKYSRDIQIQDSKYDYKIHYNINETKLEEAIDETFNQL